MIDKKSLNNWIENQRIISFLQEAIQCNTTNPPGNELKLAHKIQEIFHSFGIESQLFVSETGRANLTAQVSGRKPGKKLVFNGHLDTVSIGESSWEVPPFSAEMKEGKIYGRGTSDMKGGLVALMYACIYCHVENVIDAGELIFAATFGEETGSLGAKKMIEEQQLADFDAMIIGEPTDNEVIIAHKGVLWVQVESTGKTAHASMPAEGINALQSLHTFLNRIQDISLPKSADELLSDSTLSVTTMKGGFNPNVVPDYGLLTMDIRTLPEQDHEEIMAEFRKIASDITSQSIPAHMNVQPLIELKALKTDPQAEIVQTVLAVVQNASRRNAKPKGINYFTDGSVFSDGGKKDIVIMGPGKPELAHQPNEYIQIESFVESINLYIQIAERYLNYS